MAGFDRQGDVIERRRLPVGVAHVLDVDARRVIRRLSDARFSSVKEPYAVVHDQRMRRWGGTGKETWS